MRSYSISCEIKEPVMMNCWKHHRGFVRSKIKEYADSPGLDLKKLLSELLLIGDSLMDLYLGELKPDEIADLVISFCRQQNILTRSGFEEWLKQGGDDYRMIELTDTSKWTLRMGEKEERYIHIHPSRSSPNTIRVRSASLKSAILFKVLERKNPGDPLAFINKIRKEYLNLPPLKNLKSGSALIKLIDLLNPD